TCTRNRISEPIQETWKKHYEHRMVTTAQSGQTTPIQKPGGTFMYTATSEERNWAMLAHILALVGYIAVPFGNIIAPLIIYLMKKDQSPFIADHARESLNFQISMTIYAIIAGFLIFVLIGLVLLPVIYIAGLALTILATVKASNGVQYRYPFTLRIIN